MSDRSPAFYQRLDRFIDVLGRGLRSDTQRAAFARYVVGLLSDTERKSIEPIAARTRPNAPGAEHDALLYFVNEAPWNDHAVRRSAAAWGLWAATTAGPVRCTIIDDTGFLKSGKHSVGVSHQYTGSAGKLTNCQVAVSLSVATEHDALPVDMTLYLPYEWTIDELRRQKAKIPPELEYQPKWKIALNLLHKARDEHVPLGDVVLADSDYGRVTEFRTAITDMDLHYGVGVQSTQHVFARGREQTVRELADSLPPSRYRRIEWREGSRGKLSARFAFCRVRVADEPDIEHQDGPEQWLVIEWRDGEDQPEHFHLSSRPRSYKRKTLVKELKERWRTERVYEDLKGEVGLDHYEGRGWIGWNHHVSVVLCCYALLVAERIVAFPPCATCASRADAHPRAA